MTRDEYLSDLLKTYSLVSVLSDKNGCRVLRLRNKQLKKDLIARIYDTVQPTYNELCTVNCENLPLIYDTITLSDGQAVLEEYISGVTVGDVMLGGKYRYLGAKRVLISVCNALSVLHERSIIHRDLKPENVMISDDGRVILIDFNAARQMTNATKDTVVMGTVGYASPEQLGLSQSDPRTDIYALGVMLNVMLTGQHPSIEIAKGKAGKIVRKCTHLNADERFQTVEQLIKAL